MIPYEISLKLWSVLPISSLFQDIWRNLRWRWKVIERNSLSIHCSNTLLVLFGKNNEQFFNAEECYNRWLTTILTQVCPLRRSNLSEIMSFWSFWDMPNKPIIACSGCNLPQLKSLITSHTCEDAKCLLLVGYLITTMIFTYGFLLKMVSIHVTCAKVFVYGSR